MTPELVLAALLQRPVYDGDRNDSLEDRRALFAPVADAIANVVRSPEEAAALIALGDHETHFARYVLEGRCTEGPSGAQCDRDARTGQARARGPWQVWNWCKTAWQAPDGSTESLRGGAACAIGSLRAAKFRCSRSTTDVWAGAFSGYRGGADCQWPQAASRVRTMRRVLTRLWSVPRASHTPAAARGVTPAAIRPGIGSPETAPASVTTSL